MTRNLLAIIGSMGRVALHTGPAGGPAPFGWRHAGFSLQAEYFWRSSETAGRVSLEDPELEDVVSEQDGDGGYLQLGYVFPGSKWELAASYSFVDPDDSLPLDDRTEAMIGLNRFCTSSMF